MLQRVNEKLYFVVKQLALSILREMTYRPKVSEISSVKYARSSSAICFCLCTKLKT